MKRFILVTITAVLASLVGWAPAAHASSCPSSSIGGPAVAEMNLRGKTVPVKRVTFRNGGVLLPPATNLAAGISARNASLSAKKGSTIITWHVRYGVGCDGILNPLITMPLGSTFTINAVGKPAKTYKIAYRETVLKGHLKRSWFRTTGSHRLVLITCDDLRGGVFHRTMAIIAVPAPATPVVSPPSTPATPPPAT